MPFYNTNIDAIAMPCPICEKASKTLEELSPAATRKYEEHLMRNHGLEK